ncbi:MAG: hypothetical protein NTZ33_03360 [Bacteroidetes bacterium]|nr:hypothetical protein [Bacteroidota bacterium]
MKKLFFLIFIAYLATGCSSSKNTTTSSTENDGSSFSKAIIIKEKTETKGVAAEYLWIREHYPNATIKGQKLVDHKNKPYDIIKIETKESEEKEIYFDISMFFGKM